MAAAEENASYPGFEMLVIAEKNYQK